MQQQMATTVTQQTPMPRNAQAIALLLQSMGVEDVDGRVIHQLLDLTFRTTAEYLEQAQIYADHASRSDLTVDDVKLAVQSKISSDFSGPPTREMMAELAAERNQEPLPIIAEKFGVRLPSAKYCLTQPNYRVVGRLGDPANTARRSQPQTTAAPSASIPLMPLPSAAAAGSSRQPQAVINTNNDDAMDEDDNYD